MVLKPTKLPPTKKSIEEIMMTRLATPSSSIQRTQTSPNRMAQHTRTNTRHVQTAAAGTTSPYLDNISLQQLSHTQLPSPDVQHLAKHLQNLNRRLHDLESDHRILDVVAQDLAQVQHIEAPLCVEPDPKLAAKVTSSVKEVQAAVHRLDRVYFDITSAETKRSRAATTLVAFVRGHLTRKRHAAAMNFLGTWRLRTTRAFLDSLARFSQRTFRVDEGVNGMLERARVRNLRLIFEHLHDITMLRRPVRRAQVVEVNRRWDKKRRGLIADMWNSWKMAATGPRSRKRMMEAHRARLLQCRAHLESLLRYDVITPEMVDAELQKDNIRQIRARAIPYRLRMYFNLLLTHVWKPLRANQAKAHAHFRAKTLARILAAWISHFRTFQVERELQKVTDRRTFDRFPQYYNIRRIDFHYKRTVERKHFKAWAQYLSRAKLVQTRFEQAAKRLLRLLICAWRIRACYQHRIRAAAVQEWQAYCTRIFKVPFQAWLLYSSKRKARHTTQAGLIRAFHRRQHRHVQYSFFRIWKHQTMFGHVDGIHSRPQLLLALEQQKAYCVALEANAAVYQQVIAKLELSLQDEQTRLHAKESELEILHQETQATRFAMHTAEQQVARAHNLLDAVRDIHPGTIRRLERMYSEDSILADNLHDVVYLHIMRAAQAQQEKMDAHETEVLGAQNETMHDKLLLRRVKWVLSRLHLHYDNVLGMLLVPDLDKMSMQMNQMFALFEFLRSGDTTALLQENVPLTKEHVELNSSDLAVPGENVGQVADRPELIPTDDHWSKFVQDLAHKFPPQRFVPIQDRIVSYELNRLEEKRLTQNEMQKTTIYSRIHDQNQKHTDE
ncbi:hypothetical protein AeMF1_011706 [Aphanomyces euteiches]|nr:hypothetical protein AeMF1_011706 [Aphanomyces euteiches]KAH9196943.1 hypothetical protein AeNC1_001099 [Aphanomyces euteiches]